MTTITGKLTDKLPAHPPVRLGAIDVGSNSIRLVVAEFAADGTYRILDEERVMTRLASGLDEWGRLAPECIEQSLDAIGKMKAISDGFQATEIRAIATAAVRDSSNGDVLCREARRRFGLHLEVISAGEEARLAFQSAAKHFKLDGALTAVVDIGGGSVEVVLAADAMIERVYSLPLGAVRISESLKLGRRINRRRWERARRRIDSAIKTEIGKPPFASDTMIGSGGTFTTIAEIIRSRREGKAESVHGYLMTVREVNDLLEQLMDLDTEQRKQVPGLNPTRADIIVGGAAAVVRLARRLGVERISVNERGIRDGLLLTMYARRQTGAAPASYRGRERIEWIRLFAGRCRTDEPHCEQVGRLAMHIFDGLRGAFTLRDEARDLLHAAALLHDVGYLINHARHHKHAYHLIMHGELPGYSNREVELIANIARYHRRALPRKSHPNFASLSASDRIIVRQLGGILRIADGLDRTHTARIRRVRVEDSGETIRFCVESDSDPHVEVWYAEGKSDLFSRAFDRKVEFIWLRPECDELTQPGEESQERLEALIV